MAKINWWERLKLLWPAYRERLEERLEQKRYERRRRRGIARQKGSHPYYANAGQGAGQ